MPITLRTTEEVLHLYDMFLLFFKYDEDTGKLFWKKNRRRAKIGDEAGCLILDGMVTYRVVTLFGTQYPAHHIVWVLLHRKWPAMDIDHIDGNGLNNRKGNLREAGVAINARNQSRYATNSSGTTGIYYEKFIGRWRARIGYSKSRIDLGTFKTKDEAIAARKAAEAKYDFHKNHGRERVT